MVGNLYPTDRLLPSYIRPSRGSASESIAYAVGRVAVPEQDSRARDANLHNALTLGGMGTAGEAEWLLRLIASVWLVRRR